MTAVRLRRTVAGTALLCALAACGTTVPVGQRGTGGTGLADGVGSATGSPTDGSTQQPGGSEPLSEVPGGAPATAGSSGAPGAGGGTSGQPGPSGPGTGPVGAGKDRTPVRLGFTTVPDAAEFFAAFGASTSNADQASMFRAAVAWVNKNGGLNGHPIKAYIEAVSATSQKSYDQQYAELCAKYTQDDKVVAASNVGIGANTNMDACMQKANTLFVTGSNTLHDEVDYRRTPLVVSPMEVSASVLAKTLAQLIVSRGMEKKGGKVGLLRYDVPEYDRAVKQQLKPILAAAGIGLVEYTVPPPASTAAIGSSVSVVQSAELKMASQGVKTVTFLCAGCAGFFIQAANGQNYYPRYVLSSMDAPGAADGSTYERALRSSVSVGWTPLADYGTTTPPSPVPHTRTYDLCFKIQKDAGQLATRDPDTIRIAMLTCDAVLGFYYAAKANPVEPITSTSLRDGFLKLGTSYPSALSFATRLSPDRHAGASHYRLMTWNDACSCPAYSGPSIAFPDL